MSICNSLKECGYKINTNDVRCSYFRKDSANEHISSVDFFFTSEGELDECKYEIYFNDGDEAEKEIRVVLSLYNNDFTDEEIDKLIDAVRKNIEGDYSHFVLENEKQKIIVGRSNECAHIHN